MNMIVNKSDLVGYEAVNHTEAKKKALAKIVAAWESKQTKNAMRFGGFGLLAVSLAACNSSDDTTTTSTPTTPTTPAAPTTLTSNLTTGTDIITSTMTSGNDSITATYTATAATDTLSAGDVVVDVSSSDSDTITVNTTLGAIGATPAFGTVSGVENIVFNNSSFHAVTNNLSGIVGGTVTINNTQVGGTDAASATNVGSSITLNAGSGVTGTMTVALTNGSTGTSINSGSATTLSVTGVGSEANSITTKATAINLEGDGDVSGTTATDKATIVGTSATVDANGAAGDLVETLVLSGNGAAATFTNSAGVKPTTITAAGDQNITWSAAVGDITGMTMTDTSTGTFTLSISDSITVASDFSKAAVDAIAVTKTVNGDKVMTLADNATVTFSKAATTTFSLDGSDGSATNTSITEMTANIILTEDETKAIKIDNTAATGQDTITTLNITNSTAAQTTGLVITGTGSGTGATTINISGSKAVTLGASTAAKVDASSLSGILTATSSDNMLSITGGTGADVLTGHTAKAFVLDGGAGNDTFKTPADSTKGTISNFEIISLETANNDFLASQISGKTFVVTKAQALEIDAANSVDLATIDLSTLTPDASAAPNFKVDATAGIKGSVFNTSQAFNITGSSVVDNIKGYANADNISSGKGADTVDGAAGGDTIDAGAGDDSITGGTGADNITTGAGSDKIIVAAGDASAGVTATGAASTTGFDTITDFTVGAKAASGDYIDFGAATTIETNATATAKNAKIAATGIATFDASDDTLAEKIVAVEAAIDAGTKSAGDSAGFMHGSDAYIFIAGSGTSGLRADDLLLKLTGVDLTAAASDTLDVATDANFIALV